MLRLICYRTKNVSECHLNMQYDQVYSHVLNVLGLLTVTTHWLTQSHLQPASSGPGVRPTQVYHLKKKCFLCLDTKIPLYPLGNSLQYSNTLHRSAAQEPPAIARHPGARQAGSVWEHCDVTQWQNFWIVSLLLSDTWCVYVITM